MINFFTRYFPPPGDGGAQLFFKKLIKRLPGPVNVYTHRTAAELNHGEIRVIRLPFVPPPRNPSSGWELYMSMFVTLYYFFSKRKRLYKQGIHFGQIWPYGIVGLVLHKMFKINYTVFILGEELSQIVYSRCVKVEIIASLYRKIIMNASNVFVSSSFVRKNVRQLLNSFLPDTVNIFYNGIEPEEYCSSKWEIPQGFKPADDEIVIFSISRHITRKGFHHLVDSARLLMEKANNWHLYIGGVGPDTEKLKSMVNANSLHENITFLGKLKDEELHGCYRGSDIFILTNIMLEGGDADGCPIVFLEAACYGVPSIGGNVPGTYDAIKDGITGFVVDSKDTELVSDKIALLINNRDRLNEIGNNARNYVDKNYKWSHRINQFGEINDKISNK